MCEHDNIENYGHIYEGGHLVEYYERCIDCGIKVGTWSYGTYWSDIEGEED